MSESTRQQPPPKQSSPAKSGHASPDLSARIAEAMRRKPHDRVQCVRVFGDYYRCNWWSPVAHERGRPVPGWSALTTQRVRKSRFLLATLRDGQLDVEEVVMPASRAAG